MGGTCLWRWGGAAGQRRPRWRLWPRVPCRGGGPTGGAGPFVAVRRDVTRRGGGGQSGGGFPPLWGQYLIDGTGPGDHFPPTKVFVERSPWVPSYKNISSKYFHFGPHYHDPSSRVRAELVDERGQERVLPVPEDQITGCGRMVTSRGGQGALAKCRDECRFNVSVWDAGRLGR